MSAVAPIKQALKSTLRSIQHWRVPRVRPTILRTLPHDRSVFTQGLVYSNGLLYESCGSPRDSRLRCLNASNGQVKKTVVIPNDFAEGIAIRENLLYQLSWKSGKARVYRLPELELVDQLRYQGEGWGLCSGPTGLVMSDGSGTLQFLDSSFRVDRRLRVTLNRLPTRRLNDLEWVADSIYANVLWSSEILEVSVSQGRVTQIIDCAALSAAIDARDVEQTLNGIAYNPDKGTFYLTGKCWGAMYEVDFRHNATSPN